MKASCNFIASIFKPRPLAKHEFSGAARDSRKMLAMMHIPKTAGTSVMHDISASLKPAVDVRGFDRTLFGAFNGYSSISERTNVVYQEPADMPANANLVMGHFSHHTLKTRYPDAQYITFLREPLVRVLSLWVFWRCQRDEDLTGWGQWAEFVRLSRLSLKEFLSDTRIACQTDNMTVRMLLWPGSGIPADQFIDGRMDDNLLAHAFERLDGFSYSDIIENPSFGQRLKNWLEIDMPSSRLNETAKVPKHLRLALEQELNSETLELLQQRSRLDVRLWSALAARRLTKCNIETLRLQIILGGIARYSRLLNAD
ncbi:sulfotransferase family 2 domain-containing protein [Paraburkholderia sp. CNPSo 3281]|uniref:sulfotransferase family 2 domain-containing protein n=1 Tax=Paraburkholderia sp. CNPSo 3281 TaxID=2940933 RepID=UPI0020B6A5F8|nr:sulfotransferase family 2 domain-containing protein [Paraburkholderia sp. CNPSo 3281]MCP3720347.1 sulfotransferase family protein [Paraburkholderia sp. CNPSo 3281]